MQNVSLENKINEIKQRFGFFIAFIVVMVAFVLGWPRDLAPLINSTTLMIFVMTIGTSAIYMRLKCKITANILLILGIPVGLLSTNIALVAVYAVLTDPESLFPVISILFIGLLIACLLAGSGFLVGYKEPTVTDSLRISSIDVAALCVLFSPGLILGMLQGGADLAEYFNWENTALIGLFCIVPFLTNRGVGNAENLADGAIVGTLISLAIGIFSLYLFLGDNELSNITMQEYLSAANYGNKGMFLGIYLYCIAYFLSLHTGESEKINFKLKNWHLVEAFTFYLFMTIGAPTVFDIINS